MNDNDLIYDCHEKSFGWEKIYVVVSKAVTSYTSHYGIDFHFFGITITIEVMLE